MAARGSLLHFSRKLEREIYTEVDTCIGVEGHALLGEFAEGVVHTNEESDALGVEIHQPTETASESAGFEVGSG